MKQHANTCPQNASILILNPLIKQTTQTQTHPNNKQTQRTHRQELYKHQYAIARWAYLQGVIDVEIFNEPDLDSCLPLAPAKWTEMFTLRAGALRDAYADYLSGAVAPSILASAFARRTCVCLLCLFCCGFARVVFKAMSVTDTAFQCKPPLLIIKHRYGGDPTRYFGQPTVQSRFTKFPYSAGVTDPTGRCHMDLYSYHAYDKSGTSLATDLAGLQSDIATDAPAGFDIAVTEHNAHTGSNWNTIATSADSPDEASRLGAQIAAISRTSRSRGYIFKMTATPSSSGNGVAKVRVFFIWKSDRFCTLTITMSQPKPNRKTPFTPLKQPQRQNGINWADIVKAPFHHSSPTLSADATRLLLSVVQGARSIVNVNTSPALPTTAFAVAVSATGEANAAEYVLAIVNDATTGFTATLDATAWAPAGVDADVIVTQASATARAEVVAVVRLPGNAPLPRAFVQSFPANSVTVLRVPAAARTRVDVAPTFDTYVQAGTSSATTFGTSTTLLASTSTTTTQSGTNVALLALTPPAGSGANTKAAVLSLALAAATPSAYTGQLQALCLSSARWSGTNVAWNDLVTLNTLTLPGTSTPIDTVAENFVVWPAATTAADPATMVLAGGLALPPSTLAGTTVRLDVTECVRVFNGAPFGVALYRPFRNAATTNTAPIAVDDLAGGSVYSFYSADAADAAVRPVFSVWA
jgi:hypothetical protein